MLNNYFYHSQIRRTISAFGTIFNNIKVMRKDSQGNTINIQRVPLAYGPTKKFLARIGQNLNDPTIAIKLPRMSFEITGLSYDSNAKLNRMNQLTAGTGVSGTKAAVYGPSPYKMTIRLSAMANNQDDALQIIEQIIPYFQPDFTVTINELPDTLQLKTDIPITLTGVDLSEEYEGDFITRKAVVYSLDFDLRVNFYPEVSAEKNVITKVSVDESAIMDTDFGFTQEFVIDASSGQTLEGRDNVDDNEITS